MLSINNDNGNDKHTRGHQNCNTSQNLDIYLVDMSRQNICIPIVIWTNTIINHIDIGTTRPMHEGACMIYGPLWYWKQNNIVKYPYPIAMWNCEFLIIDTQRVWYWILDNIENMHGLGVEVMVKFHNTREIKDWCYWINKHGTLWRYMHKNEVGINGVEGFDRTAV